ncbi:MAG TPA: CRTAC1 family protein [Candidatus Acidoferrum sp.]|nr:CRTAC1 family protein [Candidatus Acidoferrum sp.]
MNLHGSLRLLLLLGLCACPSLQFGISAPQSSVQGQAKTPAPIVHFTDMAAKAGLTAPVVFGGETTKKYIIETTGTGVAIFDYDNDGWPDIFIVNGTKLEGFPNAKAPTSHLYHNNHDGTFTDVTEKAGLTHTGWGQGVCVGDDDNDGLEDLYVTYYGKNVLYHNNGNGTFTDVSEKAGVAGNGKAWGTGCAFVDYDRDGKLDLMVANYVDYDSATAFAPGEKASCMWKGVPVMCGPRGLPWGKNILYHNRGDGTFEDVTKKAKIDQTNGHYAFSVSTLDYDDDGWPDIFVACDSTASILYHNNRDGTFTDIAVISGAAFNDDGREQAGMGSTVGDYDGDGRPDIFKTNFSDDTSTLLHNNGDGTFDDKTFPAGFGLNTQYLGWGTMFLDVDNDGWPDLLLVNGHVYPEVDSQHLGSSFLEPKIIYHNNGNGTFTDISAGAGPAITAASSARGLAVGDLWNDGRMSAVISNMSAAPMLLVNDLRNGNHWIAFRTVGVFKKEVKEVKEMKEAKDKANDDASDTSFASNRDGIGAKITVKVGNRLLVDEVRSGSSYDSNNDMRVHFGLGAASKIEWVQVRWPSGLLERFENLSVDGLHTLREGSGTPADPPARKP